MAALATSLRRPGVHFDATTKSGRERQEPVRMDVAGFIGIAAKGPILHPVVVQTWGEFVGLFGGQTANGHLGYAVDGFFRNGGTKAWVVRLADPVITRSARLEMMAGGAPYFTVEARTPGSWGNRIMASLTELGGGRFNLILFHDGRRQEVWRNLYGPTLLKELESPEGLAINRHSDLVHFRPSGAFVRQIAQLRGEEERLGATSDQDDDRAPSLHGSHNPAASRGTVRSAFFMGGVDGLLPGAVLSTGLTGPHGYARAGQAAMRGELEHLYQIGRRHRERAEDTGDDSLTMALPGYEAFRRIRREAGYSPDLLDPAVQSALGSALYEAVARPALRVELRKRGHDGERDGLVVAIEPSDNNVPVEHDSEDQQANWLFDLIVEDAQQRVIERIDRVTMDPQSPDYVEQRVNDPVAGSSLIRVRDLKPAPDWRMSLPAPGRRQLCGGLSVSTIKKALEKLAEVPEVAMVAIPDIMAKPDRSEEQLTKACRPPPEGAPPDEFDAGAMEFPRGFNKDEVFQLQQLLVKHCESRKDRIAILDSYEKTTNSKNIISLKEKSAGTLQSRYAALYFPWILVRQESGRTPLRAVPPSGHIAGVYARNDHIFGVHKAPANEEIQGVVDLTSQVGPALHGDLYVSGVNVLALCGPRGPRIAGGRTLQLDPPWRYINVSRLAIYLRRAIEIRAQWTVFEPNDRSLWHALERAALNALMHFWSRDMVAGTTLEDAFYARCDASTNPPDQIDQGVVVCEVGVRLVAPAEFIVFRFGRGEHSVELME